MSEEQDFIQPGHVMDLGEEDGFALVIINGVEQRVDVVAAWDRYVQLRNERGSDPDFAAALVDLVIGLGFPACSQRVAVRFVKKLAGIVDEIKKKDEATQGSPGTSG